jgi:hypothetical protein
MGEAIMKSILGYRQTLITASLLLLTPSTTLFGSEDEEFPFIGLSLSHDTFTFNDLNNTLANDEQTSLGLHLGKQTQEWRTVFTLAGNNEYQTVSMEVDKILIDQLFGRPELRPYLGATIGYLHYKDISLEGDNGYYYGINFGLMIYASDVIDVDLSYHYYQVSDLDPLNTSGGLGLGIHYFY